MKNLNSQKFIYYFEAVICIGLFVFFGFKFIAETNQLKIKNYYLEQRFDFKKLTTDYLSTDTKRDSFKSFFENETEQMIMHNENTYSFLETSLTAAMNEVDTLRAQFYYEWARNVFNSIGPQYKTGAGLIIIEAKIKYFESKKLKLRQDLAPVIHGLVSISQDSPLYYTAQVWLIRMLELSGENVPARTRLESVLADSRFNYKDHFLKCLKNMSESGCL